MYNPTPSANRASRTPTFRSAFRSLGWLATIGVGVLGATLLTGCDAETVERTPPTPPPVAYRGPKYLTETVGSMTSLRGFEPLLVSGYGLVVDLDGTGAGSCPPYLKQWMIQEMRRLGMGSIKYGARDLMPERVLASTTSSVVAIEGIIPPGARRGTRFDVLVSSLPGTQTTSLNGGRLYTFNLSINGLDPELRFTKPLAEAGGPLYIDPVTEVTTQPSNTTLERQGVVLSGGIVKESRQIELVLNQPSWSRSRLIADAINGRFHVNTQIDREEIAVPVNDSIIRINIPTAYARNPSKIVKLISRIFVRQGPDFETNKMQEMADMIQQIQVDHPTPEQLQLADDVTLIWICLGKTALPVISQYYDHPNMHVRLAALEAGINLGDENVLGDSEQKTRILGLAQSTDPELRKRAAAMLVQLPASLRGAGALKILLDDPDQDVRITAYETLATFGDPMIERVAFGNDGPPKFILDLVPAKKPLVYVTQADFPRVVVFNSMTGFNHPGLTNLWDNHLMLRLEGDNTTAKVYFLEKDKPSGKTYEIAPTVANLVFLMAHQTTVENDTPGLDLTYSQVVNALSTLCRNKTINAEFSIRLNELAKLVSKARGGPEIKQRPDTEFAASQPSNTSASTTPIPRPGDFRTDDNPTLHKVTPGQMWDQTDPSRACGKQPSARPDHALMG